MNIMVPYSIHLQENREHFSYSMTIKHVMFTSCRYIIIKFTQDITGLRDKLLLRSEHNYVGFQRHNLSFYMTFGLIVIFNCYSTRLSWVFRPHFG